MALRMFALRAATQLRAPMTNAARRGMSTTNSANSNQASRNKWLAFAIGSSAVAGYLMFRQGALAEFEPTTVPNVKRNPNYEKLDIAVTPEGGKIWTWVEDGFFCVQRYSPDGSPKGPLLRGPLPPTPNQPPSTPASVDRDSVEHVKASDIKELDHGVEYRFTRDNKLFRQVLTVDGSSVEEIKA